MAIEKYPLDKLLKEHSPIQYPGHFLSADLMFDPRPIVSNNKKKIEFVGLIQPKQ